MRRTSASLFALLAFAPSAAARPVEIALVVLENDAAPGEPTGVRFAWLGQPILGAGGELVFDGRTTESVRGIWRRDPSGALARVVRGGDVGAGGVIVGASPTALALNAPGELAFYTGFPFGFWLRDPSGAVRRVVRSGDPAPGLPEGVVFAGSGPSLRLNDAGQIAFAASLSGPGVDSSSDSGLFGPAAGGGLALVAQESGPPPDADPLARFLSFGRPSLNELGEVALLATIVDPGPASLEAIYGPDASGALAGCAVEGAVAPGAPGPGVPLFGQLAEPVTLDSHGNVAFHARFAAPFRFAREGAWLCDRSGELELLVMSGDAVPGFPGQSIATLDAPLWSDSGRMILGGSSGAGDGIWTWSRSEGLRTLMLAGQAAPGLSGSTLVGLEALAMNERGDALLQAHYSRSGPTPVGAALYYAPFDGAPILVLHERLLQIPSRGARNVRDWQLVSEPGRSRRVVDESGAIALRISFTDGSAGIFLARTFADLDTDADGLRDVADNCPEATNPDQLDFDGDGIGDACNDAIDADGDEIRDAADNCPQHANPDQRDFDGDGIGDACNDAIDADGDEIRDAADNCPHAANPGQAESDGDGIGDACDPFPDESDHEKAQLRVDLGAAQAALGDLLVELGETSSELDATRGELAQCLERRFFEDADGDGRDDGGDACPATPPGEPVDAAGCSVAQFCGGVPGGPAGCNAADWRNDEPLGNPHDCGFAEGRCAARPEPGASPGSRRSAR